MIETLEKKQARLSQVLAVLRERHPDACLALTFSSPLELLVALILAAQARDELVNSVTAEVFPVYRTAADWAGADPAELEQRLKRINFYRNKSRMIQRACQQLVEKHGGQVPGRLEELLDLPGVGRKTANIILGNAFQKDVIGVDTHVGRVSLRLGLTAQEDPDKIEADLTAIVPRGQAVALCHLFQFHGRQICKARKPACPDCPAAQLCPSAGKPE